MHIIIMMMFIPFDLEENTTSDSKWKHVHISLCVTENTLIYQNISTSHVHKQYSLITSIVSLN